MTKEMILILPLWTFLSYVHSIIPAAPAYEVYISWSDIPELLVHIMISLIECWC